MNHKSGWWLFSRNSLYSTYTPVKQNDGPTVRRKHFKHDLDDIQLYSGSDSDDINIVEMKHGVADIPTMEESYEVRSNSELFCVKFIGKQSYQNDYRIIFSAWEDQIIGTNQKFKFFLINPRLFNQFFFLYINDA